jgi:DNA topoisomerase I
LPLNKMTATERFTRPPARYTEASLVKKLEELGIGRPSTYAPTISRIMEEGRGYVEKVTRDGLERKFAVLTLKNDKIEKKEDKEMTGAIKSQLVPTDMGITVSEFLGEHFENIMDYKFTAEIEKQFDDISNGNRQWTSMLKDFYHPFHAVVEETIENAERPSRERVLGKDPATGRTLLTRMSRNGPVIQIGAPDELAEGEKPRYGNLQPGQSIDSITFDDAMKLFQLPKTIGNYKNEELIIGTGRFGPYVKFGEKFISIPRGEDPMTITPERAIEIVEAKLREEAPVGTYKGFPIGKGKGRFGPFLKWQDLFINVPKKYDLDTITHEQMHELIEAKVNKEANRYVKRFEEEGIDIENGRWGPFIKFGKNMISLPKKDDKKLTNEEAAELTLEEVKKIIEAQIPDAFTKKTKKKATTAKAKTTTAKKTTAKKAAPKKITVKK